MLASANLRDGPDDDLLRCFIRHHDEAAFHAIVRRHGGMVWSICRGVLRNEADAEDAFQATFLLLATKAGEVRNPLALAGWLHEVASRISRKALTAKLRRRSHEARAAPQTCDELGGYENLVVVHEELHALPEKYRVPLVLFYFDGRTHDQAAGALGLSNSGIRKRLERGRELLQTRLARRGIAGAALTIVALPVNSELCASTAALAAAYVGGALVTGIVPAAVVSLVPHGVKSMIAVKLLAAGSLLAATACGVVLLAGEETKPSPASPPTTKEAAKPTPEPPAVYKRQQSEVGNLLNRLDELKGKRGSDEWAAVLRQLIEMGPKALPEMVAETDATDDAFMLHAVPSSCAASATSAQCRR